MDLWIWTSMSVIELTWYLSAQVHDADWYLFVMFKRVFRSVSFNQKVQNFNLSHHLSQLYEWFKSISISYITIQIFE